MVRETVALMVERGHRPGVIVNISSIARHGNRGQSNCVAAKAALAANTYTWAREFAPFGRAREALIAAVPVGRVGVPEDIWLGVKFVLECDYFTGRAIDIDGGLNL